MSASVPPTRVPLLRARRWLFAGLVGATTAAGVGMMLDIVRTGGVTALEVAILVLFAATFAWITVAFWTAVLGFALQALGRDPLTLGPALTLGCALRTGGTAAEADAPGAAPSPALTTRTALVMPACNEDPERVTRALAAMLRSVDATGHGDAFDLHLLSDTSDPERGAAEVAAFHAVRRMARRPQALHYRRRDANTGHKAGNVADFCRRRGADYDFMVVLDADSVMDGATLVALVRAMEGAPDAGLLQTVPLPTHQETLFGRLLQFAACLSSPMLATGQAFWQGDAANYWGHNAIVRMAPFVEHARLPVLPGRPPLGGEIWSHDFVEAALLRRAGWKVYLVPGLGGSCEEVPGDVPRYAKRDRRWCQGSLQHLRLLRLPGLHPLSRVHFVLGAMGYVSSALWLLLLLASTAYVVLPGLGGGALLSGGPPLFPAGPLLPRGRLVSLLAVTAAVLLVPKLLALGLALARRERRRGFGGALRLVAGWTLELVYAVVVAPLMMMHHARAVASVLAGHGIRWEPHVREGETVGWAEAVRRTGWITAAGAAWAGLTLWASPAFFLWMTPIFAGLLLAAPLVRWTSSRALGTGARRLGLFLVPEETGRPSVLAVPGRHRLTHEAQEALVNDTMTQETRDARMIQAERGLFELRRGRPLCVTPAGTSAAEDPTAALVVAAVEGLSDATLERLARLAGGPLRLVVTHHRARAMGLLPPTNGNGNGNGSSGHGNGARPSPFLSLGVDGSAGPDRLMTLASAASAAGEHAATALDRRDASALEASALTLVRLGRLLPALVAAPVTAEAAPALQEALERQALLAVDTDAVAALAAHPRVEVTQVSDAPVPLAEAEDVRFVLFREANGLQEHVAVLLGEPATWPDPVPVRVHSACLTGDLFGSLRCDCGEQLRGSLTAFARSGGGVLLYLSQEGRGIGLGNKLRAYTLQGEGLDTVDADGTLGFGADERSYDVAIEILHHLGIGRIQLFTNNPEKVRALEEGGIRVLDRQPLHGRLTRHNLPYVRAKAQRAGHWLQDMLAGRIPGEAEAGD